MKQRSPVSNVRFAPDQVLVDIADYVLDCGDPQALDRTLVDEFVELFVTDAPH